MPDRLVQSDGSPSFGVRAFLLCFGYGLFHACCFSGPLSTAYFGQIAEICFERRLPIAEVMPVNFIVFAVCACPSMALLGVFGDLLGSHTLWNVFTALGVTATVALIPALPSSSSTASLFALKTLPENESYESRAARTREDLALRFGFSPRKHEVFELLVQGKTRSEIAEQLVLSTWTVKQYIASIYAKVGVHSAKELMDLVARC